MLFEALCALVAMLEEQARSKSQMLAGDDKRRRASDHRHRIEAAQSRYRFITHAPEFDVSEIAKRTESLMSDNTQPPSDCRDDESPETSVETQSLEWLTAYYDAPSMENNRG